MTKQEIVKVLADLAALERPVSKLLDEYEDFGFECLFGRSFDKWDAKSLNERLCVLRDLLSYVSCSLGDVED